MLTERTQVDRNMSMNTITQFSYVNKLFWPYIYDFAEFWSPSAHSGVFSSFSGAISGRVAIFVR